MSITDGCFELLLRNQGLLPVSHVQLMRGRAGAGRGQSQQLTQAARWKCSTPGTAQFVNGGWPGGRNPLFSSLSSNLFESSTKSVKSARLRSLLRDCYTPGRRGGEKNCIVYSLLCISIILISLLLLLLVVPLLSY